MESNGLPDEYVDQLVQEFADDPIRLNVEEDSAQVLYDRKTLETLLSIRTPASPSKLTESSLRLS